MAQFQRRFSGNLSQAEGWQHYRGWTSKTGEPMAGGEYLGNRRAWRAMVEIHGSDTDLGSTIWRLQQAKQLHGPALHGCGVTTLTLLRRPADYLRSKFLWYIINNYIPSTTTFEDFGNGKGMNPQAVDLMRGFRFPRRRECPTEECQRTLERDARAVLAKLDIVAPTDRFNDLLRVLCDHLSLPRCPCAPRKRVIEDDARQRQSRGHYNAKEVVRNVTPARALALAMQTATVDLGLYSGRRPTSSSCT